MLMETFHCVAEDDLIFTKDLLSETQARIKELESGELTPRPNWDALQPGSDVQVCGYPSRCRKCEEGRLLEEN
jgi:hypothetical protein